MMLERQIREYGEYLDSLDPNTQALRQRASDRGPHHQARRAVTASVVVVLATIVAVSAVWALLRQDNPGSSQSADRVPARVGPRIPLHRAPTPEQVFGAFLSVNPDYQRDESVDPLTLDTDSATIVSIVRVFDQRTGQHADCLTVVGHGNDSASACSADGQNIFFYNETVFAPARPGDLTIYYSWSKVPRRTAYVAFRSPSLDAWQRPIDSTVVFPAPRDGGAKLVAYTKSGARLGTITYDPPGLRTTTTSPPATQK
jgi:hypothetical protein